MIALQDYIVAREHSSKPDREDEREEGGRSGGVFEQGGGPGE